MAQYRVLIPVCGAIVVTVEAASSDEAKDKAFEENDWSATGSAKTEVLDFEAVESVAKGNVCYAPYRDIEITEGD